MLAGRVDRGEDRVLAPKSGEERKAGQRQAPSEERPVRDGHDAPQPAEAAHVDDAAHRVHDTARAEEQAGLEEGVREQVEHSGERAGERAGSQREEHVTELADGGVGEDALEVGLRERNKAGE